MMPTRARTREQNRAARITAERQHNHLAREARRKRWQEAYSGFTDVPDDGEPPPF